MEPRSPISHQRRVAGGVSAIFALALLVSGCGASTKDLGLAPVTVNGSVQTFAANRYSSEGSSEITTAAVANMTAQTYIWHPWFATVSSDLNVAYDYNTGDRSGSSLRAGGALRLDVLPESKYPVSISAGHTESRLSGDFVSGDIVRDYASLDARAAFTPTIKGGFQVAWDRSDQRDSGVRTGMRANMTLDKTFNADSAYLGVRSIGFQAGGRRNDFTASDPADDDRAFDTANVRLTLRSKPSDTVDVDTRLGATMFDLASGTDEETRLSAQGLTTLQWRPEELPFNVTGALRVLWEDVERVRNGQSSSRGTKLALATAGLRWPVSDNLSVNLGLRAGYEDVTRDEGIEFESESDETGARFEAGFLVGINYRSDRHDIGGFEWRWTAAATADNGIDTKAGFDSIESIQVGHEISRQFQEIFFWPVTMTVRQGFDITANTEDADGLLSAGLTHSLTLGYSRADRETSRFGRVIIRDSRNLIGATREFQAIQLRFGERIQFDRDSRLSGNLGAQFSRSVSSTGDTSTSANLSADVTYEHRHLFEIEGLFFRSILRANIVDLDDLFGFGEEVESGFDGLENDWRNILTYRIGRLSAETEASTFYRNGGFGYLVMFRLRRDFGGTL